MALIVFVYCTCAANLNFFSNTGAFSLNPATAEKALLLLRAGWEIATVLLALRKSWPH